MHLVDLQVGFLGAAPIVASTIPIAVGTAFASVIRREQRVSVAFFGDGATEEGVFHEAINFAALKKLPIVLYLVIIFLNIFLNLFSTNRLEKKTFSIAFFLKTFSTPVVL